MKMLGCLLISINFNEGMSDFECFLTSQLWALGKGDPSGTYYIIK